MNSDNNSYVQWLEAKLRECPQVAGFESHFELNSQSRVFRVRVDLLGDRKYVAHSLSDFSIEDAKSLDDLFTFVYERMMTNVKIACDSMLADLG